MNHQLWNILPTRISSESLWHVQFTPWKGFEKTKKWIRSGVLGEYDYAPLLDSLEGDEGYGKADYFLVGKDFPSYVECQEKVDQAYRDQEAPP